MKVCEFIHQGVDITLEAQKLTGNVRCCACHKMCMYVCVCVCVCYGVNSNTPRYKHYFRGAKVDR